MSESLGTRVGRIVSGGFNALVDAVENSAPEVVMEQAIREVDDVIAEARRELGTVEANRHLASRRQAEESNRLEDLQEKAELALNEGRQDLAEVAVKEILSIEDQLPILAESLATNGESKTRIEGYIRALQAKKREMQAALADFRESRKPVSAGGTVAAGTAHANTERELRADSATAAFDRVLGKATGLPGLGNANPSRAAQLGELDDMAHDNRVAERLRQLRAGRE